MLAGCQHQSLDVSPMSFATQRVRATKTLYLGIYGNRPPLVDTVIIQGTSYQSAAFDSTTFQYDQQDRLIRLNLLQLYSHGSDYPGQEAKTIRNAHWTEYVYQTNKLLMRTGYESQTTPPVDVYWALLDASQRRIASRSWYDAASFTTAHDTLQTYSSEGLLISSLQILTRAGFAPQTIRQTALVEAGNVVQMSTSFVETGQAFETTTYEYDLSHQGPLSTTTMYGKSSRNALLRATTVRYEPSSSSRYEYTYSNEYDQRGRLLRQTDYYQSPGATHRKLQTLTKFYYQ